ncbi:MAG: hypothetical protein AUI14_23230 [Actinobacteria bacterium 13_2_20CM_2_71_6]|nr:MAG: hypothetical protein AUI14_23230 [Actinobacteria bacterium 13_2_20CM_2_71_6]
MTSATPIISAAPGSENVCRRKCPPPKRQTPSWAVDSSRRVAKPKITDAIASAQRYAVVRIAFVAIARAERAATATSTPTATPTTA